MDRDLDIALREIRARITQADPLLVNLVRFAAQGSANFQYGIAVRLGAVTIYGVPSPATTTGQVLDEQTLRFVQVMHAMDLSDGREETNWPDIEQMIRDKAMFANAAKSADEAYSKIVEYAEEADLDEIPEIGKFPDHLVATAITALAPPKAFTLINAEIRKDDGTSESVENIRINLSAVEAWWTFELSAPDGSQEALEQVQRRAEERASR
jgi:hypothetical protein